MTGKNHVVSCENGNMSNVTYFFSLWLRRVNSCEEYLLAYASQLSEGSSDRLALDALLALAED